jgi:hypothetical protein
VQLTNFRSAIELSYKTTSSDWIKIEDDPDDIYVFEAEDDKKYQVSIKCPYNERGRARFYVLDQKNFPQLDLGCDDSLDPKDFANLEYSDIDYYSLDASFTASYLIHPYSHNASERGSIWTLFFDKRRIDHEAKNDIVGLLYVQNEFCKFYLQKNVPDIQLELEKLNLLDRNHWYDMPLYIFGVGQNQHISYFQKSGKIYSLGNGCANFDMPSSLRGEGDGYLFAHSSFKEDFYPNFFGPSYHYLWTSSEWYQAKAPSFDIPDIALNPKIVFSIETGKVSVSIDKLDIDAFSLSFYSW